MTSELTKANGSASGLSRDQSSRVIRILEGYLGKLEQGCPPHPDDLVAEYPELGDTLRAYLDKLALLHNAASGLRNATSAEDAPAALLPERGRLGDFRIVREIGRGGMGIVYEAEQISLSRRVALKVLPFATALDAKQLARFKKEAQAAAHLHHTHIVPVHAVGTDRGVHYYAMQFIEGQTVAAMITELRQLAGLPAGEATARQSEKISAKTLRRAANKTLAPRNGQPALSNIEAGTSTKSQATLLTRRSTKNPAFFRTVARLGVQAAEALDHAHQMGVVHRDIKPANLLVDARSHVWITDFGLAIYQSDGGLTLTGDLLGTLRYMSPEQALAKRFMIDHRTDIYSLGVTLYELVTLEPPYNGKDRQELLRQIAFEEPKPPRALNPSVPVELETVLLKAMNKDLDSRYSTAQELADDLRRFLENKPILARRPTVMERFTKWCRRHKAMVLMAIAFVMLALGGLLACTVMLIQKEKATQKALNETKIQEAEAQRMRQIAENNYERAISGVSQLLIRLENKNWDQIEHIKDLRRALSEQSIKFLTSNFVNEQSQDAGDQEASARTYLVLATIYRLRGELPKVREAYFKAIRLYERLAERFPENPDFACRIATCHNFLALATHDLGDSKQAATEFSRAVEGYRKVLSCCDHGLALNDLAWLRATCPLPEFRDPQEAVTLAEKAVKVIKQTTIPGCPLGNSLRGNAMNTLGVAYYRAGNNTAAVDYLQQSVNLRSGGDGNDWFFLAMAYCKLGDRSKAMQWYQRGINNPLVLSNESLANYQSEAETVLGLVKKPPSSLQSSPKERGAVND